MSAHLKPGDFHDLLTGDSSDKYILDHLKSCPLCEREWLHQKEMAGILGRLPLQKASMTLRQRVIDDIPGKIHSVAFRWVVSFAVAGGILIGVLFFLMTGNEIPSNPAIINSPQGLIKVDDLFSAITEIFQKIVDISATGVQFFSGKVLSVTDQMIMIGGIILLVLLFYLIDSTIHYFKHPSTMNGN